MSEKLIEPQPITPEFDISEFDCERDTLNNWLTKRALKNEDLRGSRTFVVCDGNMVAAYYSLAVGSVDRAEATPSLKRNMPDPIPVMLLGRLAVDKRYKGRKIGPALLRDAILRTLQVSDHAGLKAIMVHALDEDAKAFYERHGFRESPSNPMTLFIGIAEAAANL